jgi:hypothetical protein
MGTIFTKISENKVTSAVVAAVVVGLGVYFGIIDVSTIGGLLGSTPSAN